MSNIGLKDAPIGGMDEEALGFGTYARALATFAMSCDTPMTIALQGDWGSGKTSMMNLIGDARDKTAIIFDDEIDTAGTLTQAASFLIDQGAKEVYASATHAILSGPAIERLKASPIKELVVSNTVNIPPEKTLPNMTVLSIAPLIGEVIRRIHLGISVGEMFNE